MLARTNAGADGHGGVGDDADSDGDGDEYKLKMKICTYELKIGGRRLGWLRHPVAYKSL